MIPLTASRPKANIKQSKHHTIANARNQARYYDKEKVERWQREAGVQFPIGTLRNAHGNTIYTKTDLVKLREANPTFYQSSSVVYNDCIIS